MSQSKEQAGHGTKNAPVFSNAMDALLHGHQNSVVMGLKSVAGVVQRLEIDDLITTKEDTFNLYMLALGEMQAPDYHKNKMSFNQIAGIHGLPRNEWDDVSLPGYKEGGYCAHGLLTFGTWHRPYVSLMEQAIFCKMLEIAEKYDDETLRETYRKAALQFRQPYWDPFRARGGRVTFAGVRNKKGTSFPFDFRIPTVFVTEKLNLKMWPKGDYQLIDNPLYDFNLPKESDGGIPEVEFGILEQGGERTMSRLRTIRYPNSGSIETSNLHLQTMTLNKVREQYAQQLVNMLTDPGYNDFKYFSNDQPAKAGPFGSLESFHGDFHDVIGGISTKGHMSKIGTAAFDPVFWMYHCNIDRLLAIWQATHPQSWFPQPMEGELTEDTPLIPFRAYREGDQSIWWTSKTSRKTSTFGYCYPDDPSEDTALMEVPHDKMTSKQVLENFCQKYAWSLRTFMLEVTPPPTMQPPDLTNSVFFKGVTIPEFASMPDGAGPPTGKPLDSAENIVKYYPEGSRDGSRQVRQWFIDCEVERHALDGDFTVIYFIGPFNESTPEKWQLEPTMAGINHVFVGSVKACANCKRQAEASDLSSSTTPITPILMDYIDCKPKEGKTEPTGTQGLALRDMEPPAVLAFLRKNLRWRVLRSTGEPVIPLTIPSLAISISCKLSEIQKGSFVPVYGDTETYESVIRDIVEIEGKRIQWKPEDASEPPRAPAVAASA